MSSKYSRKEVIDTLRKVECQKAPGMDDIESKIINEYLSKLESCARLAVYRLQDIYNKLLNLIFYASSKKITGSLKDYVAFVSNGSEKEINEKIDAKRITKEMIDKIITEVITQEQAHPSTIIETNVHPQMILPPLESNSNTMFQEASEEEVEIHTTKIISGTNSKAKNAAFIQLEILARTKQLWMHDSVWDVLDGEIRTDAPKENFVPAVYLLKRMLKESKEKSDGHDRVVNKSKQLLMDRFIEIISSTNQIWYEYKEEAKQILQYITYHDELFLILWRAWKQCVPISDTNQFNSSVYAFHGDLRNFMGSNLQNKKIVEEDLFELMYSSIDYIASRARALHS